MTIRWEISLTTARTVRVVCLSSTLSPRRSGRSWRWQTVAVTSLAGTGAGPAASRSPRETSSSSASRTVTDCGAQAV
jgi:hypothetical protein